MIILFFSSLHSLCVVVLTAGSLQRTYLLYNLFLRWMDFIMPLVIQGLYFCLISDLVIFLSGACLSMTLLVADRKLLNDELTSFSTITSFQLMAAMSRMKFSSLTFSISRVNRLCFLCILKDLDFGKMAKDGKWPSEKFTVILPDTIPGWRKLEKILSIRVSFLVFILAGIVISGAIRLEVSFL